MNTKQNKWESGAFTRRLIGLPALVILVSLTFTAAASAQTAVPFQASVNDISQNGQPSAPCPTIYYCGSASIAGYGAAFWSFDESPKVPPTPLGLDCFLYTGTSTFTLLSDGSTLVLNEENVLLCHPGNSGNTPGFQLPAYGHPNSGNGNWTLQKGNGQFKGLTGGSGTDTLRTNGALLELTWSGTVTSH
jgi:hypothetical protein